MAPATDDCTKQDECDDGECVVPGDAAGLRVQLAKGENYNVDKAFPNGCEIADSPLGNHAEAQATAGPDFSSCGDGESVFNLGGIIPSDQASHENPVVSGFVAATGSAPDWISIGGWERVDLPETTFR